MANKVKLKTLVEKMNLKNLTPDVDLSEKEVEELTEDERIKKRNALLDEQFGIQALKSCYMRQKGG